MTITIRHPQPRIRPPRPWIPNDPPETVLPAWMYARREPRFPYRIIHPDDSRTASTADQAEHLNKQRCTSPRIQSCLGLRTLVLLTSTALLASTVLHACTQLTAFCPL